MQELSSGFLLHERYLIQRVLGKGGMGLVYLAEDQTLHKEVALKVNFHTGEESSSQFLQEARLLAALHHPHLPRVTDYFVEEPCQYLVMDYLPGLDLQTLLEREGRQSWEVIRLWADDLSDALTYMHSRSLPVIHRDIKPGNIKLRSDGSAVLVDFGIAKAAEASQKTSIGARGYTPGFAPPEQAGGGRTGSYSDQYAFAATIYNLLTGIKPVDSVKRVLEGQPLPDAITLNLEIPEYVSEALKKAMSIKPEDRFGSVSEFQKALHNPAFTIDQASPPVDVKPSGKRRVVVLAAAAILLATALAGWYYFASGSSQPDDVAEPVSISATVAPTQAVLKKTTAPTLAATPTESNSLPAGIQSELAKGRWLAYSSTKEDGKTWQIWLMSAGLNREGKPTAVTTRQLTTGPGDKLFPAWSPDGKYIVYSAPASEGSLAYGLDIWRISVDGGTPVDLSNREGDDLFPSWNPNGLWINFTNRGSGNARQQLYLMGPAGEDQTVVRSGYDESQAVWLPDGKMLLHVISAGNTTYFAQRAESNAYSATTPYDTNQTYGRLGAVSDPGVSPDGTRLAYTRTKGHDRWVGIVEYSSRGGKLSLITKTGKDFDPAWSLDGRWIAFTSERDGIPQIYMMTSAGLVQTGVSELTEQAMYPAWQP